MKTLWIVLPLLLMGARVGWAEAEVDCPPGTYLKKIGTVSTANDTTGIAVGAHSISSQGHNVRAARVSCGSTACVATLYDTDLGTSPNAGETANANVVDEPGAIASSSGWTWYDPPLTFSTGIGFSDDGNVNAVLLYECR